MEEEIKLEDIKKEVQVKIEKTAFNTEKLHCDKCNKKLYKIKINVEIPDTQLSMHLESFRCKKCGEEFMNSDQAEKLDRALIISKAISKKGIIYERAGNFDGTNIFVRFPAQLIKGENIKAEITSLSSTEYLVNFKS